MGRPPERSGNPMGKGVGLSGSRSSNDQQRWRCQSPRSPVLDRTPLLGVDSFEVGGCRLQLGGASIHCRNKRRSVIPAVIATGQANWSKVAEGRRPVLAHFRRRRRLARTRLMKTSRVEKWAKSGSNDVPGSR